MSEFSRRIVFTFSFLLIILMLSTSAAHADAVLMLASGSTELDAQFKAILQSQGHVVTIGQFSTFTGGGLAGQDVVLLLPNVGGGGDGDMPAAGQSSLVSFVSAGGGLVTSEWTTWMTAFSGFSTLVQVLPAAVTTAYGEGRSITYKQVTANPLLNGNVPASLTFVADDFYGTETFFAPRTGATVFYSSAGSAGGAGVVGWQFRSGRVLQFSTVLGPLELADSAFRQLVVNAVAWVAPLRLRASILEMTFEPVTVRAGDSSIAKFSGSGVTNGTYLDVRFRAPGSPTDEVALNWQQGPAMSHSIPTTTSPGIWNITGVRAHEGMDDHTGDFDPVTANLAVIQPSCFVTTVAGDIQGVDRGSSCAFLGIPYAAAPVGNLRWKPPQPSPRSSSVLYATSPPPNCAAISQVNGQPAGSEDCLRLNIWLPKPIPTSPAPVLVWIHTGAFIAASANFPANDGQKLAEKTGLIVVAPNYRLGSFGFLAHSALTNENAGYPSSGNYGFLDQRAALGWVRDNIAQFGGDPGRVTIGGQSAGAHSVSLHLVSPGSGGLFQRAVMESGYASTRWRTREEGEIQGNDFASALGCVNSSQVLSCMRSKSQDDILRALPAGRDEFTETATIRWSPVVDGLEIPDQPRLLYEGAAFHRVPILLGATRDEGWIFVDRSFPAGLTATQYQVALEAEFGVDAPAVLAMYRPENFASPKEALAQITGDVEYVCEATRVAQLVARTGTPVYLYSFDYVVNGLASNRVIHGLDTNFVFGNNFVAPSPANYVLNPADLALSRSMTGYWTRFVASGDPNAGTDASTAIWPALRPSVPGREPDKYLVLDTAIREDRRLREEQCNFLRPLFFRSVIGAVPAFKP